MTEPLYPTHNYPIHELTRTQPERGKKRLKNVTWCLGDKPCRTLSGPITWTSKRKGK